MSLLIAFATLCYVGAGLAVLWLAQLVEGADPTDTRLVSRVLNSLVVLAWPAALVGVALLAMFRSGEGAR
jgi:hypothetical protein